MHQLNRLEVAKRYHWACFIYSPYRFRLMFRTLLTGLLLLAFVAEVSAQTAPTAPATVRHTTQQKTTTHRTTAKPRRTTVRKTSTRKVGMVAPSTRPGAVVVRQQRAAAAISDPASGKGQGVYAAPGEPVNIQSGATTGYDGAAPRRAKAATTLTPTPAQH